MSHDVHSKSQGSPGLPSADEAVSAASRALHRCRVPASGLFSACDPAEIPFPCTDDAPDSQEVVGQDRAVEAACFGIGIRREGYNLFALGPHGVGKRTLLDEFLQRQARERPTPSDWCYVANLEEPHRPNVLKLPPGMGAGLRQDMQSALQALRSAMGAAFDSDEYRTRKQALVSKFNDRQERALSQVQERASQLGIAVVKSESGIVLTPLREGRPLETSEFQKLAPQQHAELQTHFDELHKRLHALFRQFHDWAHEHQRELESLDRETASMAARRVLDEVRTGYSELPEVLAHLDRLEQDAIDNAEAFLRATGEGLEAALSHALHRNHDDGQFRRYQVNVMVDNGSQEGVPVVYEENPTYPNLVGRIEHVAQFGALVTDFTLIRPGALHRANGGYLLLDALKVLQHPFAWEGLKRAVRTGQIRTEKLEDVLGLMSTVSLLPEPIPLNGTKVVLVGERRLYYMLAALDPDFLELFKVMVDFEDSMDRGGESHAVYARLIASLVRKEALMAMDRGAVARVIEQAARLAGDAEKLSVQMRPVVDLLREADHFAASAGREVISAADVQAAIDGQRRRAGRLRERLLEEIHRQTMLIDTAGEAVAQVNGLAVVLLGETSFGYPTRITARVRMGKGDVVDIERQVELGGPIHSKGVLILSGFLSGRYVERLPLSLWASLVFEQSYGTVEGDSASLAELCALLSALARVGVRQCLAVTGSVNQHGRVQPIGGVNEKIEGFFDVCRDRGLTGDEGVLIPAANRKHLMLRRDVVEAVEAGRFQVYAVEDVDQAMEILTGRPAGDRTWQGEFPAHTLNRRVEDRLTAFAEDAHRFASRQRPEH